MIIMRLNHFLKLNEKFYTIASIYEGHMASACIMINDDFFAAAHEDLFL